MAINHQGLKFLQVGFSAWLALHAFACGHAGRPVAPPISPPDNLVSLNVMPRVCLVVHGGCTIRVRLRIQRYTENAAFQIEIDDSSNYYSSNIWELEGDRAAITQPEQYYNLPYEGLYAVTAVVYNRAGTELGRQAITVQVGTTAPLVAAHRP